MSTAKANGINISYKVRGHGEPLVLIMGYSGARQGWFFQEHALRKHFTLITFDNRGIGKTDRPEGPYTTRMMAEDTIGVIDHLGIDRAHVLGVSMGGMIAQELAINHPDRVGRLVLGCTLAGRDDTSGYSPELVRALGVEGADSESAVTGLPIAKLTDIVVSMSFNRWLYRLTLVPLQKLTTRLGSTRGLSGQLEACLGHDTLDRLQMIHAPTLVIAGTADRVISPPSSEVLASTIPGARLVRVARGSHAMFIEMRGRFNQEVLDFLRAA